MGQQQRLPSTIWHALLSSLRADHGMLAAATALSSPQQGSGTFKIVWSYQQLAARTRGLSRGLVDRGVSPGDVVATDLPNVAHSLLLQLACARLGAAVVTATKGATLPRLVEDTTFRCAVVADPANPWIVDDMNQFRSPHILAGGEEMEQMLAIGGDEGDNEDSPWDDDKDETAALRPLAYFGSSTALTHGEALRQGQTMKEHLGIFPDDKSCVSITLYHPFGIGSACSSALLSGSTIVLPAVGGLRGCGVPSQRARVTLDALSNEKCTLVFADTHTLKAFAETPEIARAVHDADLSAHLRGGVCKTGSGSQILRETVDLAGVTLSTLGKSTDSKQ